MAATTTAGSTNANWRYIAVDPQTGSRTEGKMRASSKQAVISQLEGMGLTVGPVSRTSGVDQIAEQFRTLLSSASGPKISTEDLATVTKQLQVLLRSGLSPADALGAVVDAAPNDKVAQLMQELSDRVRQGETLSEALDHYQAFPESYKAWVESAEQTGQLDTAMNDLYEQLRQKASTEASIKSAMAYPKLSLGLSIILALGMVRWLVPQFSDMLAQFDDELPTPTQILVAVNDRFLFIVGVIAAAVFGVRLLRQQLQENLERGAQIDAFMFRVPVLGQLLQRQMVFRWASTMAGLTDAGVHLNEALDIAGRASGSRWVRRDTPEVIEEINEGRPLSDAVSVKLPAMPELISGLIATGERVGKLPEMMRTAAASEANTIDSIVETLGKRVETFAILAVVGIVGGIIAALWVPLLQLSASAADAL